MRNLLFGWTAAAAAMAALAGCETMATKAEPDAAAAPAAHEDPLYLERFERNFGGGSVGLAAYDTLAPIGGAATVEPLPKAPSDAISPESLAALEAYAADKNSTSLMVWHKGALALETYYGGTTPETLIISRSLAKPLATLSVGRAIAEGHIADLDQPAADFFPEWRDDDRSKITVRHLLDMRTGLLPQGWSDQPDHILNLAYLHPRHDEIILADYPLVNEPGERYEYANSNSELIAPLIERATGVQYEDWAAQEVLSPIGAPGGEIWMNRPGGTAHSGCCVLLPAQSYLRMAILLLQDGAWDGVQLLPDGYVEEMRTATPQNLHAGMGVYVAGPYVEGRGAAHPDQELGKTLHSEPYLADDLFLFDGNGHQVAYIIPSADLVVMRTGTRPPEGLVWDNPKPPNMILADMTFEDGARPTPQPGPPPAYSDEIITLNAPDGREISVRSLTPTECDDSCPLIIFSHGAFAAYDRYDALLLPFAEAGYRIAAPNHVDSEDHPDRASYGQGDAQPTRLEDYAAISAHFDAETEIAFGHSFGAIIAQIAGGAELPDNAPVIDAARLPDAVVAISPPGLFPGGIDAEGWSKLEPPMLLVTGTTDILPGFVDTWQSRLASFEAALNPLTFALIYEGMDHYFDGAYGREREAADAAEADAREAALDDAVSATLLFLEGVLDASGPTAEDWSALADDTVQALVK